MVSTRSMTPGNKPKRLDTAAGSQPNNGASLTPTPKCKKGQWQEEGGKIERMQGEGEVILQQTTGPLSLLVIGLIAVVPRSLHFAISFMQILLRTFSHLYSSPHLLLAKCFYTKLTLARTYKSKHPQLSVASLMYLVSLLLSPQTLVCSNIHCRDISHNLSLAQRNSPLTLQCPPDAQENCVSGVRVLHVACYGFLTAGSSFALALALLCVCVCVYVCVSVRLLR
jgi:hypothetical protein